MKDCWTGWEGVEVPERSGIVQERIERSCIRW